MHRFVVTTYNLWTHMRWEERAEPLRAYLQLADPDILCLQELQPLSRALIDETLVGHQRVDDPFEGWAEEGNLYWRRAMFELLEHGAEDLGQQSLLRRLFWTRLRHRLSGLSVLVSTAHFTWQGNPVEVAGGPSARLPEAHRTLEALDRLAGDDPVLFMGDLNDASLAIKALRAGGLVDSFTRCGAPLQPTHPARPTADGTPQVLDWQFHRGPIRSMSSHVGEFFSGEIAPSDHKPVVATYAIGE